MMIRSRAQRVYHVARQIDSGALLSVAYFGSANLRVSVLWDRPVEAVLTCPFVVLPLSSPSASSYSGRDQF